MTGRCEVCSRLGDGMHRSTLGGVQCDAADACCRRRDELKSADAWYAAEVYRMKELAPA
mgnify:CR=1 FL=1